MDCNVFYPISCDFDCRAQAFLWHLTLISSDKTVSCFARVYAIFRMLGVVHRVRYRRLFIQQTRFREGAHVGGSVSFEGYASLSLYLRVEIHRPVRKVVGYLTARNAVVARTIEDRSWCWWIQRGGSHPKFRNFFMVRRSACEGRRYDVPSEQQSRTWVVLSGCSLQRSYMGGLPKVAACWKSIGQSERDLIRSWCGVFNKDSDIYLELASE